MARVHAFLRFMHLDVDIDLPQRRESALVLVLSTSVY